MSKSRTAASGPVRNEKFVVSIARATSRPGSTSIELTLEGTTPQLACVEQLLEQARNVPLPPGYRIEDDGRIHDASSWWDRNQDWAIPAIGFGSVGIASLFGPGFSGLTAPSPF